jgi:lipoate-protein ligase A
LGVAVEVAAPRERAAVPSASPCFERPAAGELVVDGRKLVGSAQWRDDGAMLQHGSILIEDDQPLVNELVTTQVPPSRPAATLTAALGRTPSFEEVTTALFDAVRLLEDSRAAEIDLDTTIDLARNGARHRYSDDRWTWRR